MVVMFIWGKFRYDAVALTSLAFLVVLGFVPAKEAFVGFGHPAVITVALVLLISKGLEASGLIGIHRKNDYFTLSYFNCHDRFLFF